MTFSIIAGMDHQIVDCLASRRRYRISGSVARDDIAGRCRYRLKTRDVTLKVK